MNHSIPRLIKPLATVVFGAIVLVACSADEQHDLVARSDVGNITRAELESYILTLNENRRRPDPDQDLRDWRRTRVEDLLLTKALAAEAEDMIDTPRARASLQRERLAVLVNAYTQEFIDGSIDVSEEALHRYYDEHVDEMGNPEQIRLRHIFRRVDMDATPTERAAKRAEMEDLLAKLKAGANFGDVARTESDSETAPRHGLIGRLDRGTLDPALEKIVWNLDDGELSEVVETPVGFHIFRLDNHIPAASVPFDEARGRLTRRVQNEERERLSAEHFEALLEESGAVYRPELLNEPNADPSEPVFQLEDHVIRLGDVRAYAEQAGFVELRKLPADAWLKEAARNRLFAWKAEEEGLDKRPDIAEQIEFVTTKEKVRIATEPLLLEKLAELEADGVLEQYYDENYLRFQTPMLHRLRVITVSFDRFDKPYDAYEFLNNLKSEIESGRLDMADAARRHSDDPSAENGGDLGWIRFDAFGTWYGPRVQNAVVEEDIGQLVGPLLIEFYDRPQLRYDRPGYMLARLEEIRRPEVRPYDQALPKVRELYIERHRRQLEQAIRQPILAKIHAEIIEENL